jgi:hypothetical protein
MATAAVKQSESQTALSQSSQLEAFGFVFDPSNPPFTLLEELVQIAKQMRDLNIKKTGGKASSDPKAKQDAKYGYFEEAEIASFLAHLLAQHNVGYAAGTPKITWRGIQYRTNADKDVHGVHVLSSVMFTHKASREWIVIPGVGEAADSGDKAVTKAITSAIKYIWMKTFLISEGNDIELSDNIGGLNCGKCTSKIIDGLLVNGKEVSAKEYAERTKKAFGSQLCGDCAAAAAAEARSQKAAPAAATPPATTKAASKPAPAPAKPQAAPRPAAKKVVGAPDRPFKTTLIGTKARIITVKGTKKTVYDLRLEGVDGNVTDFHVSHQQYYKLINKPTPIELVYDEKVSGKYTNRNVVALMTLGEDAIEDESGNKYSQEEPDGATEPQGGWQGASGSAFDDNDEQPFE